MVKFMFFTLALLSLRLTASEPVSVEVSLPIYEQSDTLIRDKASTKAVYVASEKLPSIIWGEETLRNQHFNETIRSIGFAQATVTVITEEFDRQNNAYILKANVFFDNETIMKTLDSVAEGERAKSTISAINKALNNVKLEDFVSNKMIDNQLAAKLLVDPSYLSENVRTQLEWHTKTTEQLQQIVKVRVDDYIKTINIEFDGVVEKRLIYRITAPAFDDVMPEFDIPELQQFFELNTNEIFKGNNVCNRFVPGYTPWSTRPIKHERIDTTISIYPEDHFLDGKVLPVIFYRC
ncbi:MAG: hypothetical protein CML22_07450 [Rheinheimera sp.]|nr:hypothetical protein [Rheinheimera sp.]MBM34119.1 hypothetical protein [Rheinheimera sp.]|tara:strand:+ start:13579 stop:14457 length:879 start_codon:yes stop_codon:yes gene_type:complete